MVETIYCVHCGAVAKHPVIKIINGQSLAFCCGGCVEVYEMMHEEELLAGEGVPVVTNTHSAVNQQNGSVLSETILFHVAGMSCANCVATVTRQLCSVPGVQDVSVVLVNERATVKMIPNQVSLADLQRAVEKAGYELSPESGA